MRNSALQFSHAGDYIDQFRAAITGAGLTPPETIELDGKLHRFASNGKRSDDAGWYVVHGDGIPAGAFGDWRTGAAETWRADIGRRLSAEEETQHRARVAAIRCEREAEDAKRKAEAREKAAAIWRAASPAPDDHAYLLAKGVKAHGLRVHEGALVAPMRHGAELHSLQFIADDGSKKYLFGGRVTGCYFPIGTPNGALCIVEGYATGASIFEATGCAVAVAFNAGNLLPVARALREKFPDLPLTLCADDDAWTDGNPGLTKAREAAQAVGGLLAVPHFGADRPEGATDFNDMAAARGAEAVREAIQNATAPDVWALPAIGAGATNADWHAPEPLPKALSPVPAFDPALLPEALRPWIEDIAERMACPLDYPAIGAMVALAAVVGRRIGIRPKRRDDWLVVPNLWGAIVGRPGVLKSPALAEAMRPLERLAAQARESHAKAMQEHGVQAELTKAHRDILRAELRSKKDRRVDADIMAELRNLADADTPPAEVRYLTNDPTVEKLGELLAANPAGVLVFRDELTGWLRSLDRDGHENDRAFYLEAWSGTGGYVYDRIGRGTLHIPAACVAVLGGIQPGPLAAYVREAHKDGRGADGLFQRFQLLVWPDEPAAWRNVDRWPDSEAKNAAFEVYERLATLDASALGAQADEGSVPFLRFEATAQAAFDTWRTELETTRLHRGEPEAIESHLAKYRSLVPSLALLIHLADGSGPVSEAALLRAADWSEYLEAHARRAYAEGLGSDLAAAQRLAERIRRGDVVDGAKPKDIYLKGWSGLDKEATYRALDVLAECEWLRVEELKTGGRPSALIRLNPRLKEVAS